MTPLGHATLQQIALTVLAQHAGPTADANALAAAAHRAYDELARASSPLIGQVGVDALTSRALHLAQRDYPWLVRTREETSPQKADGPFAQAVSGLKRQPPHIATEAAVAVFTTLTGLLVTFIGERLTAGLLSKAWPDAFSDATTEEHTA
jgi:hypothetical protein